MLRGNLSQVLTAHPVLIPNVWLTLDIEGPSLVLYLEGPHLHSLSHTCLLLSFLPISRELAETHTHPLDEGAFHKLSILC